MRSIYFCFIALIIFSACKKNAENKPVWINAVDTVYMPGYIPEFATACGFWEANLLTAVQPIELASKFSKGKLSLNMTAHYGLTKGPSEICLKKGGQCFFYPVYVLNIQPVMVRNLEYRSPKTVNPDSGLQQQRIVHDIDVNRNILATQNGRTYFFEKNISLPSKAGVFRAIQNQPITSYYVQPGSCTDIPITAEYVPEKSVYRVIAGPLNDRDNNTVANGTSVVFIYKNSEYTWRMEVSLLDGYAVAIIPADKNYKVKAVVYNKFSKEINLSAVL